MKPLPELIVESPLPQPPRNSASSASIFSGRIRLHIRLLLTRSTGASPHAPKHSPSCSVTRPSAVVSPKPMPSFALRCSAALTASCSAHGRFVQIVILYLPTGCGLYIA